MVICKNRLGLGPSEFWKLTFAEFWALYEPVTAKEVKPLTKVDLKNLEKAWTNGDFRRASSKSGSGNKRS